jgi:hypothetical protein
MGNTQSNLLERLDDIASEYILDADYQTLQKLKDQEYCNKVTIVTKEILDKQFHHLDIEYLAKRAKTGWDWDWQSLLKKTPFLTRNNTVIANEDPEEEKEENDSRDDNTVTYPDKTHVDFVTNIDNPNKEEMCLSISTFYVKIGHIFAAIVGTIQPVYAFNDGSVYSILTPKQSLPDDNTGAFRLAENGFCYKRIETLKFGTHKDSSVMNPRFCNSNTPFQNTAKDIPGVPEFEMLYYDEIDKEGNPAMSEQNRKMYEKDLETFYKKFTHQETIPMEIQHFSDIPLIAYDQSEENCQNQKYNQPIRPMGSDRESPLFEDYANNLRDMIQVTGDLQQRLVDILNKIFTKKKGEEKVTIDPKVKMETLDKLIVETRNTLLELFVRCEEYFENGVNIYKAIVNDRIINNTFDAFVAEEIADEMEEGDMLADDQGKQEEEEEDDTYRLAEDEYLEGDNTPLDVATSEEEQSLGNLQEMMMEDGKKEEERNPGLLSLPDGLPSTPNKDENEVAQSFEDQNINKPLSLAPPSSPSPLPPPSPSPSPLPPPSPSPLPPPSPSPSPSPSPPLLAPLNQAADKPPELNEVNLPEKQVMLAPEIPPPANNPLPSSGTVSASLSVPASAANPLPPPASSSVEQEIQTK